MHRYSVIITTHRRPLLLRRAIESVRSQSFENLQLVVVSDIACDETSRLLSPLLQDRDMFVDRRGAPGPAQSRNIGMRVMDGDFAIFLDDDDTFNPNYLSDIDRHATSTEILYTDFHVVFEQIEQSTVIPLFKERRSLADRRIEDVYIKNFIPQPCMVFPRAALDHRAFDPDLVLNEDWDFILNVCSGFRFRHVPVDGPVVHTRQTADNRGRSNDHHLVDVYRRVYKRWPAPTRDLRVARQSFFAASGLEALLEDL